jgi:hypothetical protein
MRSSTCGLIDRYMQDSNMQHNQDVEWKGSFLKFPAVMFEACPDLEASMGEIAADARPQLTKAEYSFREM